MRIARSCPTRCKKGVVCVPPCSRRPWRVFPARPTPRIDSCWEPGACAYLANGGFVPLSPAGEFVVDAQQTVPEVDALNLMTVEMADALSAADKQHLSGGKIIVIGTDDDTSGGLARVHAQALAQVLAMPRIHLLPSYVQWIIWAVAAWLASGLSCAFLKRKHCCVAPRSSLPGSSSAFSPSSPPSSGARRPCLRRCWRSPPYLGESQAVQGGRSSKSQSFDL
jgi:hypothetical protein